MLIHLTHDSLREVAVATATAIPVIAVAYYTVRGDEPDLRDRVIGFDLPHWLHAPFWSGVVRFLGRAPVADGKVWIAEEMLRAADSTFLRSFAPGLLLALLSIGTGGDPRLLALSLLLLFAQIGQLATYVTVTALVRRAERTPRLPAPPAAEVVVQAGLRPPDPRSRLQQQYGINRSSGIRRRLTDWSRRLWVRLPRSALENRPVGTVPTGSDLAPFRTLRGMVIVQIGFGAVTIFIAFVLWFQTRVIG